MTLAEIRSRRKNIETRMRELLDTAERENRDLNPEETTEWDSLTSEDSGLKTRGERMERLGETRDDLDRIVTPGGDNQPASRVGPMRDDDYPSYVRGELNSRSLETADDPQSPIIRRDQSVIPYLERRGLIEDRYEGLTFGGFVRAMVHGARTPVEKRALSEGTDSAGGYTVPTILLARLIDRLRAKAVLLRAGAVTVPLETEKTSIAKLATDPVAAWRAEHAAVAESDPTFDRVEFTARSLAVLVKASRELIDDSLNIEQALMNAFAQSMALELDRVGLLGSGTAPEPRGIANTVGVGSVDMGANGAALADYDPIITALQVLADENAADPTAAVMAPRTAAELAKLKDTTGQPLRKPDALANLPFLSTTAIPVNQTHGTANNASRIITGDFAQLMVGIRTALRVEVLRERFAENLEYGFLAHLRADVQLAHAESFAQVVGIIP